VAIRNLYLDRYLDSRTTSPKVDAWSLDIPIWEIPPILNPFYSDGVDLYAAIMYRLPYENIKFLTVLGLLVDAKDREIDLSDKPLVEATSGNTGIALGYLGVAHPFNAPGVILVVNSDLPDGKRDPLVLTGAEIIHPRPGMSGIATARAMHKEGVARNLDQYANPAGYRIHEFLTGPAVFEELPEKSIDVLVADIGTGGTVIGLSRFFKQQLGDNNVTVVGALLEDGEEVPGVRDRARMKEISLPWEKAVNQVVEVPKDPCYRLAAIDHRFGGVTGGPSSGMVRVAANRFLAGEKLAGRLDSHRHNDGRVRVLMVFPDGSRAYGDRFMANVPFHTKPEWFVPPFSWELFS